MPSILIPLFYRPADMEAGIPSAVTLHAEPDEGAILLTRENFEELLEDLCEHGVPRFHLFDMPAEARAAEAMLMDDSRRSRGHEVLAETGVLRDGEGVVMVVNEDRPITGDRFQVIDHRSEACRKLEAFGSWELTEAEIRDIMDPEGAIARHDLAAAIAGKISEMPVETVQNVQISMENIPGAYVGYLSLSVGDVRGDYRLEGIEPEALPDAAIHAVLKRSSSKVELPDAFHEAMDDVADRLRSQHPEIFRDDDPAP